MKNSIWTRKKDETGKEIFQQELDELLKHLGKLERHATGELEKLYDLLFFMNNSFSEEVVIQMTARTVIDHSNTARCVISILDESDKLVVSVMDASSPSFSYPIEIRPYGISMEVIKSRNWVVVNASDTGTLSLTDRELEKGIKTAIGFPLKAHNQIFGVMKVDTTSQTGYEKNEFHLLLTLAECLAIFLYHIRRYADIQKQLDSICNLIVDIAESRESEQVALDDIATRVANMLDAAVAIRLLTANGELIVAGSYGLSDGYVKETSIMKADEGIIGIAIQHEKTICVEDVAMDDRLGYQEISIKEGGIHSFCYVPISFQEDIIGVLCVYGKQARQYSEMEQKLLKAFAAQTAIYYQATKFVNLQNL